MFKKQESLLSDVVGGAAIGIAVGMIVEKVLSPRTPIVNSSSYGIHSPVQWQSRSNQLQYVPSPHHCHRIYASPCHRYKERHCNKSLHSEYEDSSVDDSMSSLQSSKMYNTSTEEYTTSSEVFSRLPNDSTQSTSFKTRTSTTVASSKITKDNLTAPVKRTTLPKKQDSSQSKTDASMKQSIKDKSVESKSNVSKKKIIKTDLTIPAYKQKVNRVNEPSLRDCGCPKKKIDEALTELPKKYKMPLSEMSSKSKTVHCSKNESADIKFKVSAGSQGFKESVDTSKVVKALADFSTETSTPQTLIESSKDKNVTEKTKYHGIKSSTKLGASSFPQTENLKSLSETGNLATYHLTNYIDLDFIKTENSCSNIQSEKENIRNLLEFW